MSLVNNKKAGFNYELLEKFEAGVELLGFEVKSVKAGHGSLEGSYVIVRGGEAFLVEAEIPAFQKANAPENFDPRRPRKLLLTKKEIKEITEKTEAQGISAPALSFFEKGKKVKLVFALAKGKKKFDKRENIKKRETDIEMRRLHKRS